VLAALGADVVKLESIQRPDGMRFNTANPGEDRWWEWGPVFHVTNPGKRDVTLDMNSDRGRELARRLIAGADVVIENFTPRVMEHFDLGWDAVRAVNPRVVMVRMPAFGLQGPWRDRSGFAQNMEQVSGMASVTGYADDLPIIPRGPCDPVSGMHAVVALLCGLEARERTGEGMLIEVPMVEAVLNVAAEQVVEYGAYGNLLRRDGNRGPGAAPQGVYPCRGDDQWLALAVENDEQWKSLRAVMGDPMWMASTDLDTDTGRVRSHDRIDAEISAWCRERDRDDVVDALLAEGIPAAPVVHQPEILDNPQLIDRRFFEVLDHPLVGSHRYPSMPFRFAGNTAGWLRRPPPTLGQHNDEVLGGEAGLTPGELTDLRDAAVIGDRPVGA
jgi:crotonobetainyl-CoA:carnitine CoA-transferase CaiB-like acyl-CoA transferase